MKKIYLVMLLTIFPATAFSEPVLKGSPQELQNYLLDERSIMVVSGSGEETARADSATISLAVKTKEDKFRMALDKNIKIRKDVKNRIVSGGIPEERIEISKFSSTPSYSWLGDKPSSYEISNEIKIRIEQENHLLLIADIVDSFSEVYFLKTEPKHTRKQEARTRALEKSLEEVQLKKRLYEKSLGVTLTPVRILDQSVHEDLMIPAAYPVQARAYAEKSSSLSSMDSRGSGAADGSSGFGEITYKAQTQVEFVVTAKP